MKAVVKYAPGPGNIDVLDVDEPVCGANQVKSAAFDLCRDRKALKVVLYP